MHRGMLRAATVGAGRRLLTALICCLATVGAGLASPAAAGAAPDGDPVRILIVGDSMTQGSAGDFTWRYRLYDHLVSSGVDFDFVGPRRDLYDNVTDTQGSDAYVDPAFDLDHDAIWGGSLITTLPTFASVVATYRPDVVLVMLGVNDLVYSTTPAQTAANLASLVSAARSSAPTASFVLGTVPDESVPNVPQYNALVPAVAADLDDDASPVAVAATHHDFVRNVHTWDGAHPNAVGEVRIAAAFADALASLGVGAPYERPLPTPPVGPRTAATLSGLAGNGVAQLSWTGPPGATGQYVERRDVTAGEGWTTLPFQLHGTAWSDVGLTNGRVYEYRLRSVKGYWAAAADVRSNVARVRPLPPAPPRPSQPTVTLRHRDDVRLDWRRVPTADRYQVSQQSRGSGTGWRPARVVARTTSPGSLLSDRRPGRIYRYKVRASTLGVLGRWSPVIQVRIPRR